jgi:hypothetical protein
MPKTAMPKTAMSARPRPAAAPDARASDAAIVTKALLRAAQRLGVNNKVLARVIGLSEASVSRLRKGDYPLESGKPFELSVLFVRLYRSLDALTGGDDHVSASWLANDNSALGATPRELIQSVAGLTQVIAYLDARRALV